MSIKHPSREIYDETLNPIWRYFSGVKMVRVVVPKAIRDLLSLLVRPVWPPGKLTNDSFWLRSALYARLINLPAVENGPVTPTESDKFLKNDNHPTHVGGGEGVKKEEEEKKITSNPPQE
ncbi:hypothetical protein AVEN_266644-1 [Araneus ventricosus]|uniref:Uncharacterized protein n=1 Tax=Araneus ventricosus TaxID=182803 RepID=A0A4Y2KLS5_ARAVE|nr:hypothetical protein AVEN_266644-1 [Araneus ventricosus]